MQITKRELDEIQFALYYEKHLRHGTDGHNRLLLVAKQARAAGMSLASDNVTVLGYEQYLEIPNEQTKTPPQ